MNKDNAIFDLDGTLADVSSRLRLITSGTPDFRAFDAACGSDSANRHVVETLKALYKSGYKIWLMSGRSIVFYEETERWLSKHSIPYDHLLLRPEGERKPDFQLKKDWLLEFGLNTSTLCAFEDSERVIEMYETNGIPTFQLLRANRSESR